MVRQSNSWNDLGPFLPFHFNRKSGTFSFEFVCPYWVLLIMWINSLQIVFIYNIHGFSNWYVGAEQWTALPIANKFRALCGIRRCSTVFTLFHHWSLFWTSWISQHSYNTNTFLILSSYIHVGLPGDFLPVHFNTNIMLLILPFRRISYYPLILLNLFILTPFCKSDNYETPALLCSFSCEMYKSHFRVKGDWCNSDTWIITVSLILRQGWNAGLWSAVCSVIRRCVARWKEVSQRFWETDPSSVHTSNFACA
jgi:hypothetical protein